jgi:hypothetical protein
MGYHQRYWDIIVIYWFITSGIGVSPELEFPWLVLWVFGWIYHIFDEQERAFNQLTVRLLNHPFLGR